MTHIETLVFRAVGEAFTAAHVIYERLTSTVPTKARVDYALGCLEGDGLISLAPAQLRDIRPDVLLIEVSNRKYTGARRRPKDQPYTKPGPAPTPGIPVAA